ncbi:sigma-70 family RNA polymerase sigma factor [Rubellimicrobium roseum]|uniref:Sigma-70 family RNA polymerase sigma factor n=2 Tax=Rubellimicrobium roseum TaxID=687525 RepID=A0A5C4NEQ2_9RHOB|nr:sigma-70 family RNA polymerase sigma factor [Rubellimicrobium roseum]
MRDTESDWAALLRAAKAGDGRAYARFLREVAPVLRGIVRARGQALPVHHHEDIVQEVLLAIHAKRHTWDAGRPLRPWLFAIARHKVADAFRARGARLHLDIADRAEVLPAEPGPDPDAARDAARLLGRLDPRAAEIVRSAHLHDEAPAEIGRRLSMSEGAVRVALHRALKRLGAMTQGSPR